MQLCRWFESQKKICNSHLNYSVMILFCLPTHSANLAEKQDPNLFCFSCVRQYDIQNAAGTDLSKPLIPSRLSSYGEGLVSLTASLA